MFKLGTQTFKQQLDLNNKQTLLVLAKLTNKYKSKHDKYKKIDLAKYLMAKIDFQVPEEYNAYKISELSIIYKYKNINKINVPVWSEDTDEYKYHFRNGYITRLDYIDVDCSRVTNYKYPFSTDSNLYKYELTKLCANINIMTEKEANTYSYTELCDLLNEKFVIEPSTAHIEF